MGFTYQGKTEKAISELSFTIESGKTTAIVGYSGSGKSSVVKMIERYYDPSEGSIKVSGYDLKEFEIDTYRRQIGYVGQEPVLFN